MAKEKKTKEVKPKKQVKVKPVKEAPVKPVEESTEDSAPDPSSSTFVNKGSY